MPELVDRIIRMEAKERELGLIDPSAELTRLRMQADQYDQALLRSERIQASKSSSGE